jgi:DNA-binding transcriptional ArsR family regulator
VCGYGPLAPLILISEPNKSTIVPNMSTEQEPRDLAAVLFGKTKRAILAYLFMHPEESFYLRQIIRNLGLGPGAVQRELSGLSEAGLIVREVKGNQVYYQANRKSPIFEELKSLMVKTAGVAEVLKGALNELREKISIAFIYGSMAAGTHRNTSDVDLMIIGQVSFKEAVAALRSAQEKLGREVNPSVYSPQEFEKKLAEGHHFLKSVSTSPKIFLIGEDRELTKLGIERSHINDSQG